MLHETVSIVITISPSSTNGPASVPASATGSQIARP